MKMTWSTWVALSTLIGLICFNVGAFLIWYPLGFITLGVTFFLLAFVAEAEMKKEKNPPK